MILTGHRGAKEERPENTLSGIQYAIEKGVRAVEIDVHLTQDNHAVVIHDFTLERTTNGQGAVRDHTLAQIQKLNAGEGHPPPLLEEVIALAKENSIELFIEVKATEATEATVRAIQKHMAYEFCWVIAFNHYVILKVSELDPKIRTGCLLVGTPLDVPSLLKNAKAKLLALSIKSVTAEIVQQCKSNHIPLAIWNANCEEEFKTMKEFDVEYLMTDKPSLIAPLA